MSTQPSPRLKTALVTAAVALAVGVPIWYWFVERTEVPAEHFLIRIHRWGENLPEDEIVAPDDRFKGVLLDELPEGRYFLNPLFWGSEIHPVVKVPPGKCLVVTRKVGRLIDRKRIAQGDILAGDGERGIVREPRGPGIYRLNPHAYSWKLEDAIEIQAHQVGVRTLKVGADPTALPNPEGKPRYLVPDGYRGVQTTPVRPGTYYLNPYVETITPVDIRSHRVEFADIEFPSRDGFLLRPHVLVEYSVRPDAAPEVLIRLTDEGILHQEDETPQQQALNEVLQKVILPHIRGYARIEGSQFYARDFIVTSTEKAAPKEGNNREALQKALYEKIEPSCRELGIDLRAVKLARLVPPPELADQVAQREMALVEKQKNEVKVKEHKTMQKLKATEALKQQNSEMVGAKTRLAQAKTKADQMKEVEESRLKQELENAQLQLDAARQQAKATLQRGKAEAEVIQLRNEAEVAGLRKAVAGFSGVQHFAQYHVLAKLAPALTEIFASDDSDFAKLFTGYMTPGKNGSPRPTTRGAADEPTTQGPQK